MTALYTAIHCYSASNVLLVRISAPFYFLCTFNNSVEQKFEKEKKFENEKKFEKEKKVCFFCKMFGHFWSQSGRLSLKMATLLLG